MNKVSCLIILMIILTACSFFSSSSNEEEMETRVAATLIAGGTATSAVETGIASALTENAPPPTEVPTSTPPPTPTEIPTDTPIPSDTPLPTPTETPPTPSPTVTQTKPPPTPSACYKVLEDWCLTHLGCASITVLNKTDQITKIFLRKGDWSTSVSFAPGYPTRSKCTIVLRPDRYYYKFEYCGKTRDGYHALNDNWYIEFKCK